MGRKPLGNAALRTVGTALNNKELTWLDDKRGSATRSAFLREYILAQMVLNGYTEA